MRKKELDEILRDLMAARDSQYEIMEQLRNSRDPQHKLTYERASGRADGFAAALQALIGNRAYLDIWARPHE